MKKFLSVGTHACCTAASLLSGAAVLAGPEPQLVDRDRVVWSGTVPGPVPRGIDGDPFLPCALNVIDNCQPFEYPRVAGTSFGSVGMNPTTGTCGLTGVPPTVTCARVCDHFRTSASGSITSVCWWGTYGYAECDCEDPALVDHFVVTYYNRDTITGLPSTQIAQFIQDAGTLTGVSRRFLCDGALPGPPLGRTSTAYTATHAAVSVAAGTCYFIEIRNVLAAVPTGNPVDPSPSTPPCANGTGWFWSRTFATDNVCYQDTQSNGYIAAEALAGDRAFCVGVLIDSLGTQFCLPPTEPPPANDDCGAAAATTPASGPGTTSFDSGSATTGTDGQMNNACRDQYLAAGDASIFKDVWFRWTAAGAGVPAGSRINVAAGLCGSGLQWDAKMAAYRGITCPPAEADLLDCTDEMCEVAEGVATALAEVRFTAVVGQQYLLQVGGGGVTQGDLGSLTISAQAATGACCVGGRCLEVSQAECAALLGTYNGDDTDCNGTWTATAGSAAFEDIGSTGTVVPGLNDDNGALADIGFTFHFDNEAYTQVTVAVNGHIAFRPFAGNGPLYGFANSWDIDPANIPHQIMPNAYIAAAQDDLYVAPGGCGNVVTQTLGSAPNRRFIVQWNHICSFGGVDDNHFQVVLFEATGDIEVRYVSLTAPEINPVGDTPDVGVAYVMGIETLTGANTIKVNPASVVPPMSLRYTSASTVCGGCPQGPSPCPCNWNGSGGVNSQDFFDFLADFFAGNADFNGVDGTNSQDFFDFLACFFNPPSDCNIQCEFPDIRTTVQGLCDDPPEHQAQYDALNRGLHLYGSLLIGQVMSSTVGAMLPHFLQQGQTMQACTGPFDQPAFALIMTDIAALSAGLTIGEVFALAPGTRPGLEARIADLRALGVDVPRLPLDAAEASLRTQAGPRILAALGHYRLGDLYHTIPYGSLTPVEQDEQNESRALGCWPCANDNFCLCPTPGVNCVVRAGDWCGLNAAGLPLAASTTCPRPFPPACP